MFPQVKLLCRVCQLSFQCAACRIHTTARELPMKRVAIQVTIASNLPWPVTLTALTLAPQHGFRLDPSMGLATPLCPLTLHPSSTASALLFVSAKSGGRSASRGHMLRGGAGQGRGLPVGSISHSVLPSVTLAFGFLHSIIELCTCSVNCSGTCSSIHPPIDLCICSVPLLRGKVSISCHNHDFSCSQNAE